MAFCIDQSDGVTAVSQSLRDDTYRHLRIASPIAVIPNFLDCTRYAPRPDPALRARLCPPDRYDGLLLHVSNLRPVKRLDAVVDIFRRVRDRAPRQAGARRRRPRARARRRSWPRKRTSTEHVEILGEQDDVRALLSVADVFLLPSAQESFGLAALEAMACGVPVVASRVGGLPEVIEHGVTGFLFAPEDTAAMARGRAGPARRPGAARAHRARRARVGRRALLRRRIVPMYEALLRAAARQ